MPRLTLLIPLAWTILSANAHFILDFPSGLTDDTEEMATGPCGGQDFSFDGDATELAVNGFPVQVTTSHPEAMWSYRYTTDEEEPLTWTDIVPIVSQQGVGKFCLSSLNVSADLAGQTALMQVIQAGDHGNLYACALVSFVEGDETDDATCSNATGVSATFTDQTSLSEDEDESDSSTATSTVDSSTATSTADSSTASSTEDASEDSSSAAAHTGAGQKLLGGALAVGAALIFAV